MSRRRKRVDLEAVLSILVLLVIVGAIITVNLVIRAQAPCWIFPLAQAPVRCLPGGGG